MQMLFDKTHPWRAASLGPAELWAKAALRGMRDAIAPSARVVEPSWGSGFLDHCGLLPI